MTPTAPGPIGAAAEDKDGSSDEDPGPSCFSLAIDSDDWRKLGDVERAAARAYDAVVNSVPGIAGREVCLVLSTDAEVARLNAHYRGKAKPTNVLSFPAAPCPPAADAANGQPPLGDIIISLETLLAEAAEDDKAPLAHLAHLTVHGLLHLAGFDHETDGEAERMEALERDILGSLGIADPYCINIHDQPALAG
ncbi:MAG: rRNA maturation RNase YbeY [Rhodomicrobium sp.]|nr:rRNA maturation RNase YbeY [Rhodomicrobium sp.]